MQITEEALATVTGDKWQKCIEHVKKIEDQYRQADGVQPALKRIVVPLDESLSSSSSSSSED